MERLLCSPPPPPPSFSTLETASFSRFSAFNLHPYRKFSTINFHRISARLIRSNQQIHNSVEKPIGKSPRLVYEPELFHEISHQKLIGHLGEWIKACYHFEESKEKYEKAWNEYTKKLEDKQGANRPSAKSLLNIAMKFKNIAIETSHSLTKYTHTALRCSKSAGIFLLLNYYPSELGSTLLIGFSKSGEGVKKYVVIRDCDVKSCYEEKNEVHKMVAGCIIEHENTIMLYKHEDLWTLPTTFIENGESTVDAVIRSTFETSNARINVTSLFAQLDVPHVGHTYSVSLARFKDNDYSLGLGSSNCRMFPVNDIPFESLSSSAIIVTLALYVEDKKMGRSMIHYGVINERISDRVV